MERFKTRCSSDSAGALPRTPAHSLAGAPAPRSARSRARCARRYAAARVVVAIVIAHCATTSANGQTYRLGRTPAEAEIKAADTAIAPDGRGLPPGNGSAKEGAAIFKQKCVFCHGPDAA